MSGVRLLSHLQIGKEATKGTPVAATRRMDPDLTSAFTIDWMKSYHEDRQIGAYNPVSYSSQRGTRVDITYRTPSDTGLGYDQAPFFLHFPGGGTAGTASGGAGGTTYTWAFQWGGTVAGTALSYTAEFGDDVQNYEAEYVQASRIRISAETLGLTQLEADFFGRQSTKSTKTTLSPVDPVRILGKHWQVYFNTTEAGLSGATAIPNFLVAWDVEWNTGLVPRWYMDGNGYFGQSQQSVPMTGNLHLVVESNSTAISQFYDKGAAGTIDFCRLWAVGPAIAGGTANALAIDMALDYTNVVPLGGESDGVNLYDINARIVWDPTTGRSHDAFVVCSLANLSS